MKIAIPVDENRLETAVCVSLGRAPYFMFYNTENQEITFQENTAAHAQGGAGIKCAQFIVDSKSDILLTLRCGENAAEVLTATNIKIYKTRAETARESIATFEKGELPIMTQFHAGFHGEQ
ncbi:MAG: NifB/NifX family molybdenum-iron cluster-binding protein [Anaerovorax sp.]